MKANKVTKVKSKLNKDEAGTSSSNPEMTWNAICRRSSRLANKSKLAQVSHRVVHSLHSAMGLKSVEQSSSNPTQETRVLKDPPPYNLRKKAEKLQDFTIASEVTKKNASKILVKKMDQPYDSTVAYVVTEKNNLSKIHVKKMDQPYGHGEEPKQSQVSQQVVHSLHSATSLMPVEQSSSNPTQKTAAPKDPPPHDVKKKVEISQDFKVVSDITKKTDVSKIPVKKIDEPFSDDPTYHIRLDGHGEEPKQSWEKCILCNNDLSCSPNDIAHQSHADDEYKYRVKFIPQYLPAVDILPCGHAIHTECSKYVMSVESNVPDCILCLSMP
ncbi:hypothetical protein QVD17_29770 [Tagetes erecta]|uniref:Uncharacterized protein n=1 Tax=Tagetes erecta TaxID=13708 RepID=A0AAD8NMC3_TARER|nr:hypothetical protein QVD17_29770 [Tagetes erecta]